MLYTAVKLIKALVPLDSLKALVTRPALSASRHVVSDWCSVKNTEDQEGEGRRVRRVRRVRFAANAKKNDGRLHPRGYWMQSSIPREVEDEVRYVSMPTDYQDGNLDDWLHHHEEDLEKRSSFLLNQQMMRARKMEFQKKYAEYSQDQIVAGVEAAI